MPHHLIDLVDPDASYSAGQFVRDAAQAIDDIEARGRVPLLVGGTMLYLRALIGGIATLPAGSDSRARRHRCRRATRWAGPRCTRASREVDAAAAARIHPNDAQRIQRALEVYTAPGDRSRSCRRATTPRPLTVNSFAPRWCRMTARACMPPCRSVSTR